jgi:hypothetical protein
VRGELARLDGIARWSMKAGERPFAITFDPARTTTDAILAAVERAGESAVLVE